MNVDVVVVGAGPVGLVAATGFALRGASVAVLEGRREGSGTSRAAAVHAGTLDALDALGVADDLVREGLRLERFAVADRDRVLAEVEFAALPGRHRFALALSQSRTEALLLARARRAGLAVAWGEAVLDVRPDADGALVRTADRTLRCRLVVGADGVGSTVREAAGIRRRGRSGSDGYALADVRLSRAQPLPRDRVVLHVAAAGALVEAPLPGGAVRLVAPRADAPADPDAALLQGLLDARAGGNPVVEEVLWSSRFRVSHLLADTFRRGPVVLAGDAAHVHSPAGGQGMNLGLRDAVSLPAAALAEFAGRTGALDDWAAERRRTAAGVLRFTRALTLLETGASPRRRAAAAVLALGGRSPAARAAVARRLAGTADPAVASVRRSILGT